MGKARRSSVRQRDNSDCGPACIASVLAWYGKKVPVAVVRHKAGTDRLGTSMMGMISALVSFGFEARGLQGSGEFLHKVPVPFIAHMELPGGLHHYVVVYGTRRGQFRIMDPAEGRIGRRARTLFCEQWSGKLIALVPGLGTEESDTLIIPGNRARFISLMKPVWKPVLQALFSSVLYTILGLSGSLYLGKLTDHVFVTHNRGLLNIMSLAMLWISLLLIFLSVSRNLIMLKTGQVIDNQLILSYCRHLFSLPQRFFDRMKTGEIVSRINDAVKIRTFINDAAVGILVNLLILLFSLAIMFILHARLALIMLWLIPVYGSIYGLFNRINRRVERKVMEGMASLEDQFVESLQASAHIRQCNLEASTIGRTEGKLNSLLDRVYRSGINSITASGSTEAVNRIFTILLLWSGSSFIIEGTLTPGTLLTFYALTGYFTGPVSGLISANKTYQNAMIAADRLFEIFHIGKEEEPGKPPFPRDRFGDIVLSGVSFAYGSRGNQVEEVDLTIESGKTTVLTGPSGSGKSTVAALVQHLYTVDQGIITINGCDTRSFSKESIRSLIGVVPQQINFLSGTILENIAPADPDPDIVLITGLLRDTGLLSLVESLPGGLNEELTANGLNLSGGERQRLALVRALYSDPALLILDEATSSLDPVSEVHVNRVLLGLRARSCTILLITHKASYASLADNLVEMDRGRITVPAQPADHFS